MFAVCVYVILEPDGEVLTWDDTLMDPEDMLWWTGEGIDAMLYIAEEEFNVMLYFMEEVAYSLIKEINC